MFFFFGFVFVLVLGLVFLVLVVGKWRDEVDFLLHFAGELVPEYGGVHIAGDGQLAGVALGLQCLHAFNKKVQFQR